MTDSVSGARRLVDMRRLGGAAEEEASTAEAAIESSLEARRRPRVSPPEKFEGRTGYDPAFLDGFEVPMPQPVARAKRDVLVIGESRDNRLNYQHFSVVMSRSRKLPMLVACNIDGQTSKQIERSNDVWALDGRIPLDAQVGEDLYGDNDIDRGHLVRREDPNWGTQEEAEIANEDTFHFTNCTPQMAAFNQKTWLGLENYILKEARVSKDRVTVFGGPIFGDHDTEYRGIKLPLAYWKVIAFINEHGEPSATAYMIDQKRELNALEATFGRYKTYQRSIRVIEELTDLDFGDLSAHDGFSNEERATRTRIESVLRSLADVRV